ncbi:MAG: riboflavin synthase [Candidatus Cloacimonadaceae bacterium]|nr:riboflavin synthase [Candidatus Cloacimonadaceae bacterium]MDP3113217.1 riboflavin synthase [Candidatus Cloacimonadaceae bacterium]
MFTGIIEATAQIKSIVASEGKKILTIQRPAVFDDIKTGSSIACNGICLTVTSFDNNTFSVEVMIETMRKSTASNWQRGTLLNLERALMPSGRLDGHIVQGHIDRSAKVLEKSRKGITDYLRFRLEREDFALVAPQGSIAINGISLTIANLNSTSFSVALIGHTLENTNLSTLQPGDEVNLEFDVLAKYIKRIQEGNKLSGEWLHEQGF